MPIVKEAKFLKGVIGTDEITEHECLQVAFVGRSNVGKSSLQNYLLQRNSLVKSSARPGKTTEINFFDVLIKSETENKEDRQLYFADLPGYGFARMGEKQREKLRKLILWYVMYAEVKNMVVFVVLDATVGLTEFDRDMLSLLGHTDIPHAVVLNKADKCNQSEIHQISKTTQEETTQQVFVTSTTKKRGGNKIWEMILKV